MISSLNEEKTYNVHLRRLVEVKGSHSLAKLKEMASLSDGEYFIEAIVDHRGEDKADLEFLVHWMGYEDSENTWEPLSEVQDSIAMEDYLEEFPELKPMVPESE
ncbi:hypothetical protein ADUPG1_006647 [Aduncisulcus paluster]|uniref:Chromo domain-containing protein n=1 Tax=Aduncisulcus paluster TaxID=2918883 RepID=A0ABQ5KKM1_9EUKA|nr:hypothetical protein ADUPG1_006647 [Aduncisulcus paluster]